MSTTIKKTKRSISLQVKLDILKRSENGQAQASIGRIYGLAPSTIRTILRDAEKIKKCVASGSISLQSTVLRRHNRTATMIEMERILTMWIMEKEQNQTPANQTAIQEKAKCIFNDLKRKMSAKNEAFQASRGWYEKFKRRSRTNNTDSKPKEFLCTEPIYETTNPTDSKETLFTETLKTIIDQGGYSPHQIFNVGETSLFWKRIPVDTKQNEYQVLRCDAICKDSDKFTLLLSVNASGSCKLKPLLVYNSETPKALNGYNKSTLPVIWRTNENSIVTLTVFEDWFVNHFIPSVEACCKKLKLDNKALLILDDSPGHSESLDDIHNNIRVVFMPLEISKIASPIQNLSKHFKSCFLRNILQASATKEETFDKYWEQYNIFEAIRLIDESWKDITTPITNQSWTKLCPSIVPNFIKGEWNDEILDHILELATQLGLIYQKEEIEEYLQFQDQSEDVKDEEFQGKLASKVLTSKRLGEIFQHVNAAVEIMHEYDPNVERSLNVARILSQGVQCYRELYEEKRKATQLSNEQDQVPVLCLYSDSDIDI